MLPSLRSGGGLESDDEPMVGLGGEEGEEGDSLLGGGAAAREEEDFFLTGPRLGGRLAGLRSQVEQGARWPEVTGVGRWSR
jgi:hypothetical protein